jgi:copper oxidase (laccase) domain-containing protein
VTATVAAMTERYGTRPRDLVAGIGPSIGPCHYVVGGEVVEQARLTFPGADDDLLERVNGGHHFNLWAANARALREAGVDQIENSGLCTVCHKDEFFSHRGDGAVTGRFAALMGLR